jgi:hypothetical protein
MFSRILIVLGICVLFAAGVFAATGITIDNFIADNDAAYSGNARQLGIARQQILATENGGVVVYLCGYGSAKRHLFYSRNLDEGWNDTILGYFIPGITDYDSHNHFGIDFYTADSDLVYMTQSTAAGDSMLVTKILVNEISGTLDTLFHSSTSAYVETGYDIYRAAIQPIIGTDTVIMVTRGHDGTSDDQLDVMTFVSADNGSTWSDSMRVTDLSVTSGSTRIAMANRFKYNGTDPTTSLTIFSGLHNALEWWDWRRDSTGANKWYKTTNNPFTAVTQRMYGFAVVSDTIQFVAIPNSSGTTYDTLFWAYKYYDDVTWTTGSRQMNTYAWSNGPEYNFCVNSYGRLVLFYPKYFYPHSDSCDLNCMWFDFSDNTFKNDTIVSDSSTGRLGGLSGGASGTVYFSSTYYVPAAHGDVAYVAYMPTVYATANKDDLVVGRVSFDNGLSHTAIVDDTTVSGFGLNLSFTGQTGNVDSVQIYKGTTSPAGTAAGVGTEISTDTTVTITSVNDGITEYWRTVMWDGAFSDTVDGSVAMWDSLSFALSNVDSTISTFKSRNDYVANTVSSLKMVWDDDNNISGPLGSVEITTGITDPDTLQATGLIDNAKYYYWWIITDKAYTDTSAVDSCMTLENVNTIVVKKRL